MPLLQNSCAPAQYRHATSRIAENLQQGGWVFDGISPCLWFVLSRFASCVLAHRSSPGLHSPPIYNQTPRLHSLAQEYCSQVGGYGHFSLLIKVHCSRFWIGQVQTSKTRCLECSTLCSLYPLHSMILWQSVSLTGTESMMIFMWRLLVIKVGTLVLLLYCVPFALACMWAAVSVVKARHNSTRPSESPMSRNPSVGARVSERGDCWDTRDADAGICWTATFAQRLFCFGQEMAGIPLDLGLLENLG